MLKNFLFINIFLLLNTSIAYANLLGDFISSPNAQKIDQRRTLGSGSRSICQNPINSNESVSLLVPEEKVFHMTSSSSPAFYLLSNISSDLNLKFSLVNPNDEKPLIEDNIQIDKPGLVKISLPATLKIDEGKPYIWNIAIPCKNNIDRNYDVLSAGIKKVNKINNSKVNTISSYQEKSNIYAVNGIWYDAFDSAIKSNSIDYINNLLIEVQINEKFTESLLNEQSVLSVE